MLKVIARLVWTYHLRSKHDRIIKKVSLSLSGIQNGWPLVLICSTFSKSYRPGLWWALVTFSKNYRSVLSGALWSLFPKTIDQSSLVGSGHFFSVLWWDCCVAVPSLREIKYSLDLIRIGQDLIFFFFYVIAKWRLDLNSIHTLHIRLRKCV